MGLDDAPNETEADAPQESEADEGAAVISGVPNRGNTCFVAAGIQLIKASQILQSYSKCKEQHSIPVLDCITQVVESMGSEYSLTVRLESLESVLELFPELNDGLEHDTVEFLQCVFASKCKLCETKCTLLARCLMVETENSMMCTSCNRSWKGGCCDYTVLPLYPSQYTDCSVSDCLREFFDWEPVDGGLCETCGSTNTIVISPVSMNTPDILMVQIVCFSQSSRQKNQRSVTVNKSVTLGSVEYEAVGVLCHEGDSIDRGHYKAVVKDDRRNSWLLTDDSEVSPTSERYALFGCKQEACAVVYRQVHSIEFHSQTMLEESDLQQRVNTKTVDLQEQFPAVLRYLEEIMNETILSERHKNFMTGKRERKGYLFGAGLVSIELKNTLHNMLDAHFKTKKTLTQGPVDHRDMFQYQQQHFFNFPPRIKDGLKRLGYFEVESSYLREVLVKEGLVFLTGKSVGCSEEQARKLFKVQ